MMSSSKRKRSKVTTPSKKTAKQAKSADGQIDIPALTAEITKPVTDTVIDSLRQAGLPQNSTQVPSSVQSSSQNNDSVIVNSIPSTSSLREHNSKSSKFAFSRQICD